MLKAKDTVKLPHHFDIDSFIKDSKVSIQDIAKNIVNEQYPNGVPADYLHQLIKNGLNDDDEKVVYGVITELCKQQNQRNHQRKVNHNQYLHDVDAQLSRERKQGTKDTQRNSDKHLQKLRLKELTNRFSH